MSEKREDKGRLSRRDVLRTAGAGAVVGAMSPGCSSTHTGSSGPARGPHERKHGSPVGHSRVVSHKVIDAEVVVVGGGMAGANAAIAAARNGAAVVLIQNRPVLGGNSSSEVRLHVLGADGGGLNEKTDTRESGIIEELRLEEAVRNPQRSAVMWDLLLYEWARREPNLTLLLNTHCRAVSMASNDRIAEVHASRQGTEDVFSVRGKVFIDGRRGRCRVPGRPRSAQRVRRIDRSA